MSSNTHFFHAAYAWGSQGRGGRLQRETQLEQHNSQHQVHFARKVVAVTNYNLSREGIHNVEQNVANLWQNV